MSVLFAIAGTVSCCYAQYLNGPTTGFKLLFNEVDIVSAFSMQMNCRCLGWCGKTCIHTAAIYPIPPHHLSITFSYFYHFINFLWWPRELSPLELKKTEHVREWSVSKGHYSAYCPK